MLNSFFHSNSYLLSIAQGFCAILGVDFNGYKINPEYTQEENKQGSEV